MTRDPIWTAWTARILVTFVIVFWASVVWQAVERAPKRPAECQGLTAVDCTIKMRSR